MVKVARTVLSQGARKSVICLLSFAWSVAPIDSYNFETLTLVSQRVQGVAQLLRQVRCAEGSVIDDVRCDDVKSVLIHISLAGLPETPEKEKLLAIPTGLTLQRDDVDLLVQAGHDAVMKSTELRAFLDDYPPMPLPGKLSRADRVMTRIHRCLTFVTLCIRCMSWLAGGCIHQSLSMLSRLPPASPVILDAVLAPPY